MSSGRGGPSLKEMLSSSGISDGFVVVMGIGVRILTGQSGGFLGPRGTNILQQFGKSDYWIQTISAEGGFVLRRGPDRLSIERSDRPGPRHIVGTTTRADRERASRWSRFVTTRDSTDLAGFKLRGGSRT